MAVQTYGSRRHNFAFYWTTGRSFWEKPGRGHQTALQIDEAENVICTTEPYVVTICVFHGFSWPVPEEWSVLQGQRYLTELVDFTAEFASTRALRWTRLHATTRRWSRRTRGKER